MKTIIIGDIHGSQKWKKIIDKEKNFSKLIFVGDYFDSLEYNQKQCIDHFLDIVEFKKQNNNKVVLLTGNHDLHYLNIGEKYSGYQHAYASEIYSLLYPKVYSIESEMKAAYCDKASNTMITHAGLSDTFLGEYSMGLEMEDIEDSLNYNLILNTKIFGFNRNCTNLYGNDKEQSCMWIRPEALINDSTLKCNQVFGHTANNTIRQYKNKLNMDMYCIDCPNEYLIINNKTISINNI